MAIKQIKHYSMRSNKAWRNMQFMYIQLKHDNNKASAFKRVFFINALMTLLSQIDKSRRDMTLELLSDLRDFIVDGECAHGLESLLLTLIYNAHLTNDRELLDDGMEVWTKFATRPTALATGPFVFYNLNTKKLHLFDSITAQSILADGFKSQDIQSFVDNIEPRASDVLLAPFETPHSNMAWLSVPEKTSASEVTTEVKHDVQITKDAVTLAAAVAATAPEVHTVIGASPIVIVLVCAAGTTKDIVNEPSNTLVWEDLLTKAPLSDKSMRPPPQPKVTNIVPVSKNLSELKLDQNGPALICDAEGCLHVLVGSDTGGELRGSFTGDNEECGEARFTGPGKV